VEEDFEDFLGEIIGFPPKRDIDLVLGVSLMSKTPYRTGTLRLKEL
jgi:hypothetical protein